MRGAALPPAVWRRVPSRAPPRPQPLGIESAPLVRRLLDDYVTTADNLEALRADAASSADGNAASRAREIPLQADLAKLQRENDRVRGAAAACCCRCCCGAGRAPFCYACSPT